MPPSPCIVLATANAGKVRELAAPLARFGVKVAGLATFPGLTPAEETGASFEENALLKARAVARSTGLLSVADDSGLEVDALAGAPGLYSARYADDWKPLPGESRDARNMRKLLHAMAAVPDRERICRFVCCMAAVRPKGDEIVVRGAWEGSLLRSPRGTNGFGYDPLFWVADMGKSAAELTREEKFARSHRGNALRALVARLVQLAWLPAAHIRQALREE